MAAYFTSNGYLVFTLLSKTALIYLGYTQNSSNGRKMEIRAKIN
ncbi:hypothetical protein BZ17_898 [Yersinia pseudotuberculosis IP 32953]|nr:hypothetical protein DJ40_619 [Yersinia pseudotuberculosis]AJJ55965.1 hypothetical protein BZ17_898 [Yersinia pseudotuberculosis IP 32953]AJJ67538.1 hypothetical protein BZ16_1030 [Yersinia pseudotuberculosis PB1/+]AJJ04688.1 hypothetical protein BZ21_954 [Yersinia pseudotuberculosis]AJJ08012.1 hypothetical protein BZ20_371 [Yersinia pseudotuberculosis]